MRRKRSHTAFIEQLKAVISSLKNMKPEEMHVLTVHADYGNYEIVIGPELKGIQSPKHARSIEISGEIHHLFVSPESISPNPSQRQIHDKLKHTVIMQDLTVHLIDHNGEGIHATGYNGSHQGIMPRGMINMAGMEGDELITKVESSGEFNDIAYRIIQNDILHALEKRRGEENIEA